MDDMVVVHRQQRVDRGGIFGAPITRCHRSRPSYTTKGRSSRALYASRFAIQRHQLFRSVLACRSTTRMASSKPAVEVVTDYPRPPRLEETKHRLRVFLDGVQVADTQRGYRVLETFHPPTYYIPPEDCNQELIVPSAGGSTMCEWKGRATYFDVVLPSGLQAQRRVWAYKSPTGPFAPIAGYYSFYASPFDCFVDEEKVEPQPGDFYGGWKTSWIQGKIKGGPGTLGW